MPDSARAIATLERLVAFDTTSARSNAELIAWVAAGLAAQGIEARVMEQDGKANLHAVIGPRAGGGLALSAHTDCVPVEGQAWPSDPFRLRREQGRLIGRGTADMKGFLACVLAMVPAMLAAPLRRPFHLCLTHDEETSFAGAARLMGALGTLGPPPAMCVVGEPTGMAPVVAHKGYASWDVSFTGLSGHSSRTHETANALMAAAEAVAWLAGEARRLAREGRRVEGFEPPHSTVQVGVFHAGTAANIVPDHAAFAFEMRSVPGDDPEALGARLVAEAERAILPALRATFPAAAMRLGVRAAAPPLGLARDHPLALLAQRASGRNAAGAVSYGTEAGFYERAGIPAVVCGPGHIAQAHQPEEWIAESELAACCDFLGRLIERQSQDSA